MEKYLIYSLEDDKNISHILNLALSSQGYEVECFLKPSDFLKEFQNKKPNMILLDLMLPEMSGEEILKEIRANPVNDDIQIIVISAKAMLVDKIDNLNLGADDYITKPFDVLELISRVNTKSRRYFKKTKNTIRGLSFDLEKQIISRGDEIVHFTKGEKVILFELYKHLNEVVTREELFVALWGNDYSYETRILDIHIKEIRRKLGEDSDLIETIYGVGYKLRNE